MPLAPAQSSEANQPSSHDGHVRHMASAHAHQTFGHQQTGTSSGPSGVYAHGGTHDHSVPHTHGSRPSGVHIEVSPVLVGVGARVLTVFALLGLLWLAIFWAFAGNA